MKNQYFGDVGDYGKYAMLRYLANDGIKIAVNWYLTPDNGLTESKAPKGSNKFCFPEEIADYYHAGQNVVYYCQKARRTYDQWEAAKGLMQKYLPDCKIFVVTYHKGTQRSYIFVLHKEDYRRYATLMMQFCRKWFRIFTEETCGNGAISGGTTGEKFHVVNSEGVELTIEEMANGTVNLKRSDRPHEMMCISIDYFMDRLK